MLIKIPKINDNVIIGNETFVSLITPDCDVNVVEPVKFKDVKETIGVSIKINENRPVIG